MAALGVIVTGCASHEAPASTPATTVDLGGANDAPGDAAPAPITNSTVDTNYLTVDGGVAAAPLVEGPARAPQPDHVRVVIEAEPTHLNPDLEPDAWGRRIAFDALYEPLVRARADGTIEPMLADHYTIDDDGHRYLFTLREGVLFHDGKPLTSLDVAFTLDRLRSIKGHLPRIQAALSEIEHVELAGRLAVRIELRRPNPRLLETLSEIAILPAHVFDKGELAHNPANRQPVGTGPLRLEEWKRRRITLTRWEQYWGDKAPAAKIEIVVEPDGARALFAAKRGEIDLLGHLPPLYVPDQLDTPTISTRFRSERAHSPRFSFVSWNVNHSPLDDAAVRRALSLAIDRRRIVEEARHGLGRPIETVPADFSPIPGKGDAQQIAAAGAALDAAGLLRGLGGVRQKNGKPARLTLLVPAGSKEAEIAGKLVADAIGRAGLPVDVVVSELSTIIARMKRGSFDGALLEWTGVDDDDLEPILGSDGAWSLGGFQSKEIDQLLEALRLQPMGESRRLTEQQLAEEVARAAPALFLYGADAVYLYANRLRPAETVGDFIRLRDLGPN